MSTMSLSNVINVKCRQCQMPTMSNASNVKCQQCQMSTMSKMSNVNNVNTMDAMTEISSAKQREGLVCVKNYRLLQQSPLFVIPPTPSHSLSLPLPDVSRTIYYFSCHKIIPLTHLLPVFNL